MDLAADSRGGWKADLRSDGEALIAPCLKAAGEGTHAFDALSLQRDARS
jgi:hypothetical protein